METALGLNLPAQTCEPASWFRVGDDGDDEVEVEDEDEDDDDIDDINDIDVSVFRLECASAHVVLATLTRSLRFAPFVSELRSG